MLMELNGCKRYKRAGKMMTRWIKALMLQAWQWSSITGTHVKVSEQEQIHKAVL